MRVLEVIVGALLSPSHTPHFAVHVASFVLPAVQGLLQAFVLPPQHGPRPVWCTDSQQRLLLPQRRCLQLQILAEVAQKGPAGAGDAVRL